LKRQEQRNSQGSRPKEQRASPEVSALANQNKTHVDLTLDQSQEVIETQDTTNRQMNHSQRGGRHTQNVRRPKHPRKMIIHWKEAEIKNFNPHAPPAISPSTTIQTNMMNAAPSPFHPSQLLNGTHTQTPLLTVTNGPAQNRLYNPNIMGREGQYQLSTITTYSCSIHVYNESIWNSMWE
jgi:hypothetical protein